MNNRKINKVLAALVAGILIMGCQSKAPVQEDNSWRNANLHGAVKRVMEVKHTAVQQGSAWVKGPQSQTYNVKTYNTNGFLLNERSYYSDSNQPVGGYDYLYDDENNLLRVNSVDNAGGTVGYSEVKERQGKVSILLYHEFYVAEDEAILTGKTEMSWKGPLLDKTSSFDPNDILLNTSQYAYDERNDIVSFGIKNISTNQRDITMKSEYQAYDELGNWTRQFKQYDGYPVKEIVERKYEYFE